MKNGKGRILTAAGAVVVIGAAIGTVDKWAPWALATNLQLVATDSYAGLIIQSNQQIIDMERAIRAAEKRGDPDLADSLRKHLSTLLSQKAQDERRQLKVGR